MCIQMALFRMQQDWYICETNTTNPAVDNIFMGLDDTICKIFNKETYIHVTIYELEEF